MTTPRLLTEKTLRYLVWATIALPGLILAFSFEAYAQSSGRSGSGTTAPGLYEARTTAVSTAGSSGIGDPVKAAAQNPDKNVVQPDMEKSILPFPSVSVDNLHGLTAVQSESNRVFPSAIEIRGNARGLLLHALKETKYDLLSPVSLWLESGPLLVAVRAPSDMSLIATKFGDVCVSAGGDALLERGEGTLRIINLSTGKGTVNLVLHDRQWRASPWSSVSKSSDSQYKKKKQSKFESGSLTVAPGYELVVGDHSLELSEAKPADSIGRRDFKTIGDNGRFVVSEICIENLVQGHDLVRNLKEHGSKANTILSEIQRFAVQYKSKQGDEGFDRIMTPMVKQLETPKKPEAARTKPRKDPVATLTPKKQSERPAPTKGITTTGIGSPPAR
ncbi:MAG: hypothetical protein K2W95_26640 [Candidatus Obscuribacterales bacterium]|nr:hypothetical protein [Candidatus Obscuribacterales bacterium]